MNKVWTITNHKGGVGKTTATVNIGAGMVALKKKVLIVDMDPQAHASISLGIKKHPESTIYGAFKGLHALKPVNLYENFDIIPSELNFAGAENELSNKVGNEFILEELLEPIKKNYDIILIDCPPALGFFTRNAFVAADRALIPLEPEYLALEGMETLIELVKTIQKRLNKKFKVGGIFFNKFHRRKILNKEIFTTVANDYGNILLKTKIRQTISIGESQLQGLDIFHYDPKGNGAVDFIALCKELLKLK